MNPALADLIQRLTEATGPDIQLEQEIALIAIGLPSVSDHTGASVLLKPVTKGRTTAWRPSRQRVPQYTSSLDAAMTLVPHGWPFRVWRDSTENGDEPGAQVNYEERVFAATPALALCIASLKARTNVG